VYNVAYGTWFTSKSTVGGPTLATLYTVPPDDGRQMNPKHVEAW
jgi:hypothetical protein